MWYILQYRSQAIRVRWSKRLGYSRLQDFILPKTDLYNGGWDQDLMIACDESHRIVHPLQEP